MPNPTLSIIILTHNNAAVLNHCLQSIFQNRPVFPLEIIVVANACHDDTVTRVKTNFPEVIVIETSENEGFSRANNRGLKIAGGDFLMLLNDDTQIIDGALDSLVKFLQSTPRAGVAGPLLLNPDFTPQRQGGILGKKFWKAKSPTRTNFVIGAAFMIRRETYLQIGPLDENLFFYNEDLDWCRSAQKSGWQIFMVPDSQIIHLGGHSTKKSFSRKHFTEGFKGGLYFCRKHYPYMIFWLYKILLIVILAVAATMASTLGIIWRRPDYKEKARAFAEIVTFAVRY